MCISKALSDYMDGLWKITCGKSIIEISDKELQGYFGE
jgi:hypothetical protein